ncbi:MAG TPA: CopG family ribbon-helix-helix protein [Methanothermobacter sp.]|nr:CopG family ribbon-helix-helix protein [Methanothermobacter sp.]HOK72561.1 CopG family ribbon-helix-helix protein [Methanothermobacter sp.]HOL69376.1 CopG family ribbon-helix-helix protein [Methanothermobacter sp.]HPQ04048.1 CopG family ribbon-helix-helix protein [Methanothermobacter sp.]HPU37454.1 CopG family ribbon-helix-helix protein [Methanothermobacter sp.]
MTVISISISKKLLEEIDALKDEMGFSSRSDIIRTASRMLIDEKRKEMDIKGEVNGVLFLIHKREVEDKVNNIKHDYEDIINTQIHSHLKNKNCLEIFILEGGAEKIRELTSRFRNCGKMEHLKLIII